MQFFLFIYCIVSAKKYADVIVSAFNTLDVFNLLEIV